MDSLTDLSIDNLASRGTVKTDGNIRCVLHCGILSQPRVIDTLTFCWSIITIPDIEMLSGPEQIATFDEAKYCADRT